MHEEFMTPQHALHRSDHTATSKNPLMKLCKLKCKSHTYINMFSSIKTWAYSSNCWWVTLTVGVHLWHRSITSRSHEGRIVRSSTRNSFDHRVMFKISLPWADSLSLPQLKTIAHFFRFSGWNITWWERLKEPLISCTPQNVTRCSPNSAPSLFSSGD